MDTLADRIKTVRVSTGLSMAGFGRAIGVSRSAVSQLEDGTTRSLKASTIVAIEKATGYSGEWIESGRGRQKKRPGALPVGAEDQIDRIYAGLLTLSPDLRDKIEAEVDFLQKINEPPE